MPTNNIIIEYLESVTTDLNSLIDILYYGEYLGSIESAKQYVTNIKDYIEQRLPSLVKRPAPPYFEKYGNAMHYVIYNANRHTTWYIFFRQKGNRYLIRYITNNHVEGQYIR
jgi:hypothetical protein